MTPFVKVKGFVQTRHTHVTNLTKTLVCGVFVMGDKPSNLPQITRRLELQQTFLGRGAVGGGEWVLQSEVFFNFT